MPTCLLNVSVISRNTLIAGASVARKVVVFKVSARCLRVSSEFLNDSDDFTENDIFQEGSSEPGAQKGACFEIAFFFIENFKTAIDI